MPPSASAGYIPDAMMTPSLARRMTAWLYEGVLLFGVVFMAVLVFFILTRGLGVQPAYHHALQAFLFAVIGGYFVWCWRKGQTLAMKTWRIRITDAQGRPVSPARALGRYVLCWLWFLPPLAVAVPSHFPLAAIAALCLAWVLVWALASRLRRDRQFWHDVWAGTRLASTAPANAARRPHPDKAIPTKQKNIFQIHEN